MTKISDNPKRRNRILFTIIWMGVPIYLLLLKGYFFSLFFIIPGTYYLVYLGTKLRDVYVSEENVIIRNRKKSVTVPITEIASLTHYNRGVYKMCFHNRRLAGAYILFYADSKGWFAEDGPFEKFYNQLNT